ncbi:hypothetical protein BJ138DRAFT_101945 [Hygrophoropsis aurantiaca]|uniref:Uncharacterized protein n=1 Tax=Hygrophoropsis aurantiaca TaxID=72124 RepID=A0ACB8ACJ9_9AGAM|nr:hypothetical protein BJ138DRAFT_101945 [Hygrophoropsis aurantiaca]
MTEISQTVAARSGLTIEMDPTNIDFYPDASDQARLRDLEGPLSMVVWPKPSGPNSLTPSPIIGGLKRTTSGLTSEKAAQPLIEESRLSHQGRRQRSIPPATSDVGNPDAETGEPEPESGDPDAETREPEPESRDPDAEMGEPEPESGDPDAETREPEPESGDPDAKTGEPEPESGDRRAT